MFSLAGPSSWVTKCVSVLWGCASSGRPSDDTRWGCSHSRTGAWKDPRGHAGNWNQEKAALRGCNWTASQEDPGRRNQISHHPSYLEVELNWNSHKVSVTNRRKKIYLDERVSLQMATVNINLFVPSVPMCCSDLTMEIVRYRLIGPQSHSVLAETLEAATDCDVRTMTLATRKSFWNMFVFHTEELRVLSGLKEKSKSQPSSLWWPEHCKDESKMTLHIQQADLYHILKGLFLSLHTHFLPAGGGLYACWSNRECVTHPGVYSTGELPSGTVLGLTVDDPRLTLPPKKLKAMPCVKQAQGKIWPAWQTVEAVLR